FPPAPADPGSGLRRAGARRAYGADGDAEDGRERQKADGDGQQRQEAEVAREEVGELRAPQLAEGPGERDDAEGAPALAVVVQLGHEAPEQGEADRQVA